MTTENKMAEALETIREFTDVTCAMAASPEVIGLVDAASTAIATFWPFLSRLDNLIVDGDIAALQKMVEAGLTWEQAVALRVAGKQGRNSITSTICDITNKAVTKSL